MAVFAAMSEQELLDSWQNMYGSWTEDLMRDGSEAALLGPLATRPAGALRIVREIRSWDNHMQRKIAATIVGRVGAGAPATLLNELFEAEAARRAAVAADSFEVL